jgi:hypothetical protein
LHPDGTGTGAVAAPPAGVLSCDGRWLQLALRADPGSGSFRPGSVEADAFLDILDPEHFDPVNQARATRSLWLPPCEAGESRSRR